MNSCPTRSASLIRARTRRARLVVGGGVVEVVVVAVLRGDVAGRGELCRVLAPWLLGLGVTRPVDVVDEHAVAVSSTAAAARQARRRISTSFPTPGRSLWPRHVDACGAGRVAAGRR